MKITGGGYLCLKWSLGMRYSRLKDKIGTDKLKGILGSPLFKVTELPEIDN